MQKISYLKSNISNCKSELFYLVVISFFCACILAIRLLYTNSIYYRFLGFNLILAWIPYLFSIKISFFSKKTNSFMKFGSFISWLVFFPNAPYIVTDILHLNEFSNMPKWFDLMMLLAFAFTGILLGFYSLKNVQQHLLKTQTLVGHYASTFCLLFLCGVGIYFGRYARFNSWDIIINPLNFLKQCKSLFFNREQMIQLLGIAIFFTTFSSLIYIKFFKWSHEINTSTK